MTDWSKFQPIDDDNSVDWSSFTPIESDVTDTGDETARLAARFPAPERTASSFLPRPMDPLGIGRGTPLGAQPTRAPEPVKQQPKAKPYRDKREALDDAVNLLEEGADQGQVSEAFSKAGITFDQIVAHGKKRGSDYFEQQTLPTVDAETQRLAQRFPAPVTDSMQASDYVPKSTGLQRVEDLGREFAGGAIAGFKGIADVAGAENAASEVLGKAQEIVLRGRSSEAKAVDGLAAMIMEEAENKGLWDQIKAGGEAFWLDPLKNTTQGAGSIVPTVAGGKLLAGSKAVQGLGNIGSRVLGGTGGAVAAQRAGGSLIGGAMGIGMAKSQIYETVQKDALESGMTEAEAKRVAQKAQEYTENPAVIFGAGALAAASGGIGVEASIARMMGKTAVKELAKSGVIKSTVKGVLAEAPLEFGQGGFEAFAGNVGSRGAGFDVNLTRGVGTAAAMEGLSSAPLGGAMGAVEGASNRINDPMRQIAREIEGVNIDVAGGTDARARALLDPNRGALISPTDTTRGDMVGPSAPMNFTPADSPSAQAGLAPIVVPVVATQPETTDVSATSVPPLAAAGGGALAGDQLGGGLGVPGSAVPDATGLGGGLAPATAPGGGAADVVPTGAGQRTAVLNRPFERATDADLLARTEAAIAAQENNNAVVPAEQWFGRKGDGYVTEVDAQQALPGRQRKFPTLDWKVEPMASGKFRLAGYSKETTSGTQAPQTIQGQAQQQQQTPVITGAASSRLGQSVAGGGATQAQGGGGAGVGQLATGPNAQLQRARPLATPEGAAAANLIAPLRLALPAPVGAISRAVKSLKQSTALPATKTQPAFPGIDAEVDTAPLTEQQQAASAVARLLGRTVTFLKADAPGSIPNGFVVPGDNKNVFIANDSDDAPLSVAMHEIYHTLSDTQRKALNTQLAQYFRQDLRTAFASEFDYDPKNDALLDEEIPAFMVQAISKRPDFWQELRTKMGNAEFAEVAKTILAKLNTIISGAKEQYGDEFVKKYITDVAKARDLLSTAYTQAMREQGLTPDTAATGEMMQSRRGTTKSGDYDVRTMKDGTMVVYGDPEQIRAQVPEDVKGRVTKDGIVFTNAAAPRVRAALEGRQVAYSRGGEVTEKLPMKDGKYLGAPEKFNTPGKIPTLRKILRQLADEGAPGRYWYENSSREVLKMVGGDVNEARKFVALLAIYSPQAKVDANSTFALRAWAQYKAGQPISVKTGVMDTKAKNAMDDVDAFWSGEKTGNFFFNLLREIDPSTAGKQGATIDMWMMRAGQYETDAPTGTQYSFMENETNRLAQELGWEPQQVQAAIWVAMKARMENTGVKKETERTSEKKGWIKFVPGKDGKGKVRVILNEQKHRDNWLKYSFEHDVTKDDTQQAKFDFGDGLKRHIGQVSFEARPGRTTGVLPGIHSAPYAQQVEFQQAVQKAFLDDQGNDLLAMRLGLLVDSDILVPGVWQGEISPSTQLGVAMAPAKGTEGKTNVDPAQAKALNIYAAVAGLVARQEGVGWHRPFYSSTKRDANGLDINVGRPLNPREVADLEKAVGQWMADNGYEGWQDQFAFISSPNGIRLVNFGIITNEKLHADILRVAESVLPDAEAQWFASSGDMMTNNWKENQNGQDYVERARAEGRSDVLDWARAYLAPRVQRVFDDFSERYDWGDAGELRFSQRAGDGSRGRGIGGAQDRQVQASERADAQAVQGLSPTDALPGAPTVQGFTGPDPRLVAVAEQYARDNGITLRRQAEYAQVDPERAARIAAAYEAMPHAPQDLRVKAAYKELIAQTLAQYRALEKAGYKFWFINLDKPDNQEYASSPWNAMRDIRANKVMGVFPTDDGFGSGDFDPASNPLLEDTGIKWPSGSLFGPRKRVLANDLFRAVHDAFGHGLEGAGFRAQGEENAWQAHVRLFKGKAVAAITSETRGQNSWLNYGPNGESNRTAKVEDTVFADQKTGLLPEWAWTEGRVGDIGDVMKERLYEATEQAFERGAISRAIYDATIAEGPSDARAEAQGQARVSGDGQKDAGGIQGRSGSVGAGDSVTRSNRVTNTPAFRKWFGDSKVVDASGEPLVVYHGTDQSFDEFKADAARSIQADAASQGFYLTRYPEDASGYATGRTGREGANVVPAFVSLQNPYVWPADDLPPSLITAAKRKELEAQGYDGIIYRDGEEIVAFSPTQIKSATGNIGTFDPEDADIRRSKRGTLSAMPENIKVTEDRDGDTVYAVTVTSGNAFVTAESNPDGSFTINESGVPEGQRGQGMGVALYERLLQEAASRGATMVTSDNSVSAEAQRVYKALERRGYVVTQSQSAEVDAETGAMETPSSEPVFTVQAKTVGAPDIRNSNRRQKLSTLGQTYDLPATNRRDAARIKLQDDALRMKRVIEAVKAKGGKVGEAQNFYDANTLMPGRIQAAIDDFKETVIRPMIDKAVEYGIDMDELSMYAYAKHAKERNAYIASINPRLPDGGSGMTNAEADAVIAAVAKEGKTAEYEELHQMLMGITSATRQTMLSEGLITPEEFKTLEGAYDNYIPLRGFENVDEETGVARPGVGRGVNVRGAETVRAMGRKSKAGDLIENVIRDYERVIARVEKNDVGKVLLDFVLSNPDPDLWGVDVERSKPAFNKAQGTVQYTKSIEKGEDTIGVKVGGQQVYIKFADKDLTRALRQAWKDETSGLERATVYMSGWFNNWMRNVLTRYNPLFAAVNLVRDALWSGTTAALDELGGAGLKAYAKVYGKALMASTRSELGVSGTGNLVFGNPAMDKLYQEFRNAGGITGGYYMKSLEEINKDLRNDLLRAGASPATIREVIKKNLWSQTPLLAKALQQGGMSASKASRIASYASASGIARSLEFMGSASENATRFALYAAAREVGKTPAQAALLAKNGSTNFNKKGEWGGTLNNLYLFLNASIQGNAQLFKVLQNKKVLAAMGGVASMGMMMALYGAASGGEDESGESYWDLIPSHVKQRNLVIMLEPGESLGNGIERAGARGRYLAVPVQYGFNFFPNLGYAIADVYRNSLDPKKGMTPNKAGMHMVSTLFGSINPFGGAIDPNDKNSIWLALLPTILDVPYQLSEGLNSFGTPSAPEKSPFDRRPDSERMWVSQQDTVPAKIAKAINELGGGNEAKAGKIGNVDMSFAPGTIDTLIRSTTGGLGSFIEQMLTSAGALAEEESTIKVSKIPFLNRFYGEIDESANIRVAGERMREVRAIAEEVKAQQKIGLDPEVTDEETKLLDLAGMQESYQKFQTQLRKAEIEIIKDPKMTDAQKKLERQRLTVERDKMATEINREYLRTAK
jgi:GNAT superfamily N-acetyltransferase